MEFFQLVTTTTLIISAIAVLAYLNKRYDLGLNDVSDGSMLGSLNYGQSGKLLKAKDDEIKDLKQRVQVLEALVTDPKEQLKREIDNL